MIGHPNEFRQYFFYNLKTIFVFTDCYFWVHDECTEFYSRDPNTRLWAWRMREENSIRMMNGFEFGFTKAQRWSAISDPISNKRQVYVCDNRAYACYWYQKNRTGIISNCYILYQLVLFVFSKHKFKTQKHCFVVVQWLCSVQCTHEENVVGTWKS